MLTEVQVGRGSRAGVAVNGGRRRRTGRARERTVAGRLRASGRRGSLRGVPARLEGGSGRAKCHRRRVIPVNPEFTGVGARARFRGSSGRFFDRVARRASGRRGGAIAVVCKTGEAVAWPDCGGAGRGGAERRGVAARVGGGACAWDGKLGVRGRFKGGRPEISGSGSGRKAAVVSAGDLGRSVGRALKEEGGSDSGPRWSAAGAGTRAMR